MLVLEVMFPERRKPGPAVQLGGSLTQYFRTESPGADIATNWVPAPQGMFSLYLRAYWDKEAVLDVSWVPPLIKKVK